MSSSSSSAACVSCSDDLCSSDKGCESCIALYINFESVEDMNAQKMCTVVKDYYQGESPGTCVNVHDPLDLFPCALKGARGKARFNDRKCRYEIVECQQRAFLVRAKLTASLCADATANVHDAEPLTCSPHNLLPSTSLLVNNPFKLGGAANSSVILVWNSSGVYEIVAAVPSVVSVVSDVALNGLCLQQKKINVLSCDSAGSYSDIVCGAECSSSSSSAGA